MRGSLTALMIVVGLLAVACSSAASTPQIVYVTLPPATATPMASVAITVAPTASAEAVVEPTPTSTPIPTPTPKPTPTPPPWHKANEPVIVASGSGDSFLIAGGYKDFGTTCGYATAGAGNKFIVAVVMYKAGADSLFYSSGEWTVHDATNTQYEPSVSGYSCLADPSKLLSTGTLNPGLQVIGAVFFEVPARAKHLYIDWRSTMSFPSQIETWKLW